MSDTDKLQAIRAKCVELLAIAEKRTPGKWIWDGDASDTSVKFREAAAPWLVAGDISGPAVISGDVVCMNPNAAFIASSAGPAEAGWRSTIAAIDVLLILDIFGGIGTNKDVQNTIKAILTAWEGVV